ncbi:lysosome membrane protein 2-like [Physella acuta]|uniref:lysosome membrane protein 2-like n=1 Tax=Physella acuta TaxID=109671 RepID=UPI0027DD5F63|nr:lysosome membrane protein 2-like [Physella acuta]
MYVSMPHFIGGDPYYRQQVEGLHPDQSKHQPLYDIHALTGVSLRAARRYQIVVRTQSFPHFTKFSNFGVRYIPVLWIDGMAETDADTATMLKHMIQDPLDMTPYFRIATFAFSGVLVVIATVLLVYWRKKSREHLYTKLESSEREPLSRNSKIQDGTTDEPASFRKDSYGATPGQILNYNGTAGQTSNNFGSTLNRRSEDEGGHIERPQRFFYRREPVF